MSARRTSFDRVRPRSAAEPEQRDLSSPAGDADGKRALFSQATPTAAMGAVRVECSSCGVESAMTATQWVRAALPSLHLPLLRRRYPSWMRCPACGKRTWVETHLRA